MNKRKRQAIGVSRWALAGYASAIAMGLASLAGCESSTPEETAPMTGGSGGAAGAAGSGGEVEDAGGTGGTAPDAGPDGAAATCTDEDIAARDNANCQGEASDYRSSDTANDGWAACISDDGQYHPFDPNISSIPRVGAFVQIAQLLRFGTDAVPTTQNFIDARLAYQTDQGLESRVSRREDEHYPKAPAACNTLSASDLAAYPDRCVGPMKLQPILNDAFAAGITGEEPEKNAARIEAALLWFLYASVYKEATSCATTATDCDSGYAYYTGGEPRGGGLGLSHYVQIRSPQAHDRMWDGLLAMRCWRDLDNPTGAAQDPARQNLARAQLDRALLRGVALIVRQRSEKAACDGAWEFVRVLGPVLGREAALRDSAAAQVLATEVTKANGAEVNVDDLTSAIDTAFPCP